MPRCSYCDSARGIFNVSVAVDVVRCPHNDAAESAIEPPVSIWSAALCPTCLFSKLPEIATAGIVENFIDSLSSKGP